MYYYLAYETLKDSKSKYFYINNIISSKSYLYGNEDKVHDRFIESFKNKNIINYQIDGYLILDELGFKQIMFMSDIFYNIFKNSDLVVEMITSIFEKIAKSDEVLI